jgi:hypothetical protein
LLLLLSLLETSLAIANQMALAAEFGPVSGIGPCLKPQEPHESNKLSSIEARCHQTRILQRWQESWPGSKEVATS